MPNAKRYYLGSICHHAYLTVREAETVGHLLLGKTLRDTALSMDISPRTAEFYMNNIKRKLRCRTKKELIRKIVLDEFLRPEPHKLIELIPARIREDKSFS